ncbi:MAG: chemotaxis protein CheW [bacterium]
MTINQGIKHQEIKEQEQGNIKGSETQYIVFRVGKEEYGIELQHSREIIKLTKITHVPYMDEYVLGVINLRGQIVPLIDLRKRMGFEVRGDFTRETRVIIVDFEGLLMGLLVDEVKEVMWIKDNRLEEMKKTEQNIAKKYLKTVAKLGKRLIVLMDLKELLNKKE